MIELHVISKNKATVAITSVFDPLQMVMAQSFESTKTKFWAPNEAGRMAEYIVSDSYTDVKAAMAVANSSAGVHELWAEYDATGGSTIAAHGLLDIESGEAVTLPDNAYIVSGFYNVETTFTSATDAATIALGMATDTMVIKTAIAISNGANPWDAGLHDIVPVGTAATIKGPTTAERAVQATVAVEALTAGKLQLYLKYVVKPD